MTKEAWKSRLAAILGDAKAREFVNANDKVLADLLSMTLLIDSWSLPTV